MRINILFDQLIAIVKFYMKTAIKSICNESKVVSRSFFKKRTNKHLFKLTRVRLALSYISIIATFVRYLFESDRLKIDRH